MVQVINVQRKCDSCGIWNQGVHKLCPKCGDYTDHKERKGEIKEAERLMANAKALKEFEAKHPAMQVLIRIGRVLEVIYLGIISFIAWLLFWLGG